MSVCPFCKASVANAHRPCPQCGKLASEHPSIAAVAGRTLGNDFDDDDAFGELDLEQGSAVRHQPPASNPYEGGGLTLDDDFLDDGPGPGLELDAPVRQSNPSLLVPDLPELLPSGTHTSARPDASQGNVHSARPSGAQPAAGQSGRHPAAMPTPEAPPSSSRAPAPPPSSSARLPPPGPSSSDFAVPPSAPEPPRPPDPASIVAKYPPAPTKVWQSPGYALRVLWRQFELRQDLESLRRRRSPDVPLYERALKVHDSKSFVLGLAITGAGLTIATFVFFLPVILRFLRAPD